MTMMPRTAQVIVSFRDHWTWDFKSHISALEITLSDAKSEQQFAVGSFVGPASLSTSADEAVERVVTQLFAAKGPATPEPAPVGADAAPKPSR